MDIDDLAGAAAAYRDARSFLGLKIATARMADETWIDIAQTAGMSSTNAFDLYAEYVADHCGSRH
jgi:hypothetical protein